MIDDVLADWHRFVEGGSTEDLDRLLADDVVFHSPIVHTPQRGKALVQAYLTAARQVLAGDGSFTYTKQVVGDDTAVLEFETVLDGTYVNGIDLITADDGRIVEFKVMIRPLRAIDLVHQQMRAILEADR